MNQRLLRQKIDESGLKMHFIAGKLGISYQAFLNKLTGETEFKVSEVRILKRLLNLTDEEVQLIFFTPDVE